MFLQNLLICAWNLLSFSCFLFLELNLFFFFLSKSIFLFLTSGVFKMLFVLTLYIWLTRNRVQEVAGASNNMLRRSGNFLPPPVEEMTNSSGFSMEKFNAKSAFSVRKSG